MDLTMTMTTSEVVAHADWKQSNSRRAGTRYSDGSANGSQMMRTSHTLSAVK